MLVKRRHSRAIPAGAELFEKDGRRYARWTDAAGRTKVRPLNRKGDRVVEESDVWYVRLKDPQTGKYREWRAYRDRQASLAREIEIIRKLERGEMGLLDNMAKQRKKPLARHLFDFEAHLEGKGNTRDHIDKTLSRCRRIIDEIAAERFEDIVSEAVEECLADWRRGGMSVGTSNGYFRAIRTFCRWMVRAKRARQNPLVGLSCIKVTDANRRRKRRPLTDSEVRRLIETTRKSPEPFMGLSGQDRAMLYLLAVNTGLRASELASLTPESFELGGDRSLVRCQAGYTKNGQEAELPLRRDLAAMVRGWLADKPAGQPAWPGKWASQRHGAEMLRIDLTAADIDAEDNRGRVVDFHALRHTFISNLARAGVHPRNAQALARHSTIDLTMNVYTHVAMEDLACDVENLPALMSGGSEEPAAAATPTRDSVLHMPDELASLAGNWDSMPDHVRQGIATLAGV
ncbi:MAG: tyrosine-type recombinase/integrase [Ectothiorhodospiraceae bacterium]